MSARQARGAARTSVVVGTAYELLVLLYRQTQATYGLPGLPEAAADLAVPAELMPVADRFFRADIALGMNVIPVAHDRGWHSMADLVAGLAATDPVELATAMLRPPDASRAERSHRDRDVNAVLTGSRARAALLAALETERFDTTAAAELLDDPGQAASTFTDLVSRYAQAIGRHEQALHIPLAEAARRTNASLDEAGLESTARHLFPQWRFHELDTFESVVLIPSQMIAPFLSARLIGGRQALIVFPIPPVGQPPTADLVARLKAIAHPQRLEILRMATTGPITGHALAKALGLTEATVHHHTALLRGAGLLTSNRDAHRVYHTARSDAVDQVVDDIRRAINGPRSVTPARQEEDGPRSVTPATREEACPERSGLAEGPGEPGPR